jgi:hypothetical protein
VAPGQLSEVESEQWTLYVRRTEGARALRLYNCISAMPGETIGRFKRRLMERYGLVCFETQLAMSLVLPGPNAMPTLQQESCAAARSDTLFLDPSRSLKETGLTDGSWLAVTYEDLEWE